MPTANSDSPVPSRTDCDDDTTPRTQLVSVGRAVDSTTPPPTLARAAVEPTALVVGDRVLGFTLTEVLGRGAFACVFLAEQDAIAGRTIVLKATTLRTGEPELLGRLQHPNVVPIYSVHRSGLHELICMPFLGRRTLHDTIAESRLASTHPNRALQTVSTTVGSNSDSATARDASAAVPGCPEDEVLRLAEKLARGLGHAHSRGILHLDIKPANVLIADDGEPMLLDFNLSQDTARNRDRHGGTIPYMAPEQLAELIREPDATVDARSDLYGLGVLLFELLAGERPFLSNGSILRVLDERRRAVACLATRNPAVSPGTEAIVLKLLAANPADRYQSAADLQTDLARHAQHRPLRFAANTSTVELARKWSRRHPHWFRRAAAAAAVFALLAAVVVSQVQTRNLNRLEGHALAETTAAGMNTLRIDLTSPTAESGRRPAIAAAESALQRYGLPDDPDWRTRAAVRAMPAAQQTATAENLGELALLLAHAHLLQGDRVTAERWNRLAESCFPPGGLPPFGARQKQEWGEPAAVPEADGARAHYLNAVANVAAGKYRTAVPDLERAIAAEPGHAAAHFTLAYCRQQLGQYARALERYDAAQVLLPHDPRPAFNRGLVYGLQQKPARAEAEFDKAIALDPTQAEVHRNRAVARTAQGKFREAEGDLTRAVELGGPPLQLHALRAQVRTKLEDAAGAEADRRGAAAVEPKTEADYLTRGRLRLAQDPPAALADFEAATRENPRSLAGLMNQAHVLAEHLRDDTRSLAAVTRAAELFPEYAPALAGRAILLARFGRRDDAHRDAEQALVLSDDPTVAYQVAGVFAVTSARVAADADRSLTLLRGAVRDGFRDARLFATDPDLAAVRTRPDFQALAKAVADVARTTTEKRP